MTRRQVERAADLLDQLILAATIGAVADLVIVGGRIVLDAAGITFGVLAFGTSMHLTGKLGGPRV